MYTSYPFIDASTKEYQEEEVYFEEEEENFDHCTNQGKLIFLQATLMQSSTRARHHYHIILCLRIQPQVLFLQAFTWIIKASFYS